MDLLRSMAVNSPDWWPLSVSISACLLISYIIYDYFFNIAYLNLLSPLLKYFKDKQRATHQGMF
jgi:hypothetical protein